MVLISIILMAALGALPIYVFKGALHLGVLWMRHFYMLFLLWRSCSVHRECSKVHPKSAGFLQLLYRLIPSSVSQHLFYTQQQSVDFVFRTLKEDATKRANQSVLFGMIGLFIMLYIIPILDGSVRHSCNHLGPGWEFCRIFFADD
jgi:hypothetical protein